jgi:malate permease and related proteins
MEIISQLSGIVVPVFVCVAFGVLWAKVGTPFDTGLITSLVYNIGVPCLILATFQKVHLSPAAMAEVALATLACYASFTLAAFLLIRAMRLELASYLPALMFPLTGSMGLPVSYFAFGDEGLALAIVYFTFGTIGSFTIGAAIAEGKASFRGLLRIPVLYAVAIALVMQLTGVRLPEWIFNTANLLGGMVIPAQLVALGFSLLELKTGGLARSVFLGVFRLSMGVAVGFAIAGLFDLSGAARAIVVIQSAMPVAVSSYLFAVKFNRKSEEVAGMVVASTAFSFVTLPFLLLLVL